MVVTTKIWLIVVAALMLVIILLIAKPNSPAPRGYHCSNDPSLTNQPTGYTCTYTY